MKVSIPAKCGEPYTIKKGGRLYTLSRKGTERNHVIVMSESDVIAITDKLIDLIETGTNNE